MPDQTEGEGQALQRNRLAGTPLRVKRSLFVRLVSIRFWWAVWACWPRDCERQKRNFKKFCYGILLHSSHDDTGPPAIVCIPGFQKIQKAL
jgi:hypothetical protein